MHVRVIISRSCARLRSIRTLRLPTWERFLGEVFEDHPEVVDFMRRWCGYCLTGSIEEQKLPVFWGHGSNGKHRS